jgi:type IV fimbrial biogenesis protein FimT
MPLCLPPTAPRRHQGFTLIELLVTIAIVAILAALAAPSFQTFIVRNTFSSIGNEFSGSILKARNEAVTKNICTTMCLSTTVDDANPFCSPSSSTTDWQQGWIVFLNEECRDTYGTDSATNAVAAEDLLLVRRPGSASYTLKSTRTVPTVRLNFDSQGRPSLSAAGRFDLKYTPNTELSLEHAFNVCIDALGRTRSVPGTSTCSY